MSTRSNLQFVISPELWVSNWSTRGGWVEGHKLFVFHELQLWFLKGTLNPIVRLSQMCFTWYLWSPMPMPKKEIIISFNSKSGFPGGSAVKNPPANAGDTRDVVSIPGSGRSPGEGNGNPLQYSCLENPLDTGAWWVTVHGVTKRLTWLSH